MTGRIKQIATLQCDGHGVLVILREVGVIDVKCTRFVEGWCEEVQGKKTKECYLTKKPKIKKRGKTALEIRRELDQEERDILES